MSNILQTDWAFGRKTAPRPQSAGAVHNVQFKAVIETAASGGLGSITAASDIIEIGILPAFARIVDAVCYTAGTLTGLTADIGILDGTAGDKNSTTRALTTDLIFDDVDLAAANTTEAEATKAAKLIAATATDRGIGVVLSGNTTAASGKYIILDLSYVQGP